MNLFEKPNSEKAQSRPVLSVVPGGLETKMLIGALLGAGLSLPILLAASRILEVETAPLVGIAIGVSVFGAFMGLLVSFLKKTSQTLGEQTQNEDTQSNPLQPMTELTMRHDEYGDVQEHSGSLHPVLSDLGHAVLGKGLLNLMRVSDRPSYLKTVSDATRSNVVAPILVHLALGNVPGRYQPFTFTAHWCHDGCISSLQDASADLALQAKGEKSDEKSVSEDQFMTAVSTLAHELRSPLNSILGFSEILSSENIVFQSEERCREYAGYINNSGQHLLSVVDKMLISGQLEAGKFELSCSPFDVTSLCRDCISILEPQLSSVGISVDFECPETFPALYADEDCCRQMLLNILENAMKFSEGQSRISLIVEYKQGHVNLVVKDTGIGIPDEALPRLANNFERVGDTLPPKPGAGLGLALVKKMAALHGGALKLESILGEGTTATISLPCVRYAEGDPDQKSDRIVSLMQPDDKANRLRRSA